MPSNPTPPSAKSATPSATSSAPTKKSPLPKRGELAPQLMHSRGRRALMGFEVPVYVASKKISWLDRRSGCCCVDRDRLAGDRENYRRRLRPIFHGSRCPVIGSARHPL